MTWAKQTWVKIDVGKKDVGKKDVGKTGVGKNSVGKTPPTQALYFLLLHKAELGHRELRASGTFYWSNFG